MEAELAQKGEAVGQLQHSLYVVRAHWGGLRRLLASLFRSVQEASVARLEATLRLRGAEEGGDDGEDDVGGRGGGALQRSMLALAGGNMQVRPARHDCVLVRVLS